MMRLAALELVDKLQLCYGLRMLEVYRDADLYASLLKMYAQYPYNDMALRLATSVLSYALDHKLAKIMTAKQTPPKRPTRTLDLEPIVPVADLNSEVALENEQNRRDALTVMLLFQSPLMDLVIQLCHKRS